MLALAENPVAIIERCMGRQRPVGAGAHRLLPLLLLLAGSAAAAFAASTDDGSVEAMAAAARGCSGVCGITARQGATARPTCRRGLVVTGIPTAIYGAAAKRCISGMSRRIALRRCVGRGFCTIPATNAQFGGDPCPRVQRKTLWVRYRCGTPPRRPPTPTPTAVAGYSSLWGRKGELWRAAGRIVDQSYAGYMANERAIPAYPSRFDVQRYGAVGDGEADDTASFLAAIKAAQQAASRLSRAPDRSFQNEGREGVAVLVPPGKYRLTRTVEITSSNVVLRGAGSGRTTLYFPKPLAAIYGNKEEWALGGTFLSVVGNIPGMNHDRSRLTPLTAGARRGDRRLQVASTNNIQVGSWVKIYALDRYSGPSRRGRRLQDMPAAAGAAAPSSTAGGGRNDIDGSIDSGISSNLAQPAPLPLTPGLSRALAQARLALAAEEAEEQQGVSAAASAGSLDAYLYGEQAGAPSGQNMYDKADHVRFTSRVKAKGSNWVELERPLSYDLRLHWKPYIYSYDPEVQHSGFQGFTVLFANGTYPEHHTAYGYNAIGFDEAANCWVQDVKIVNADNGVIVQRSDFVTVRSVSLSVQRPRWTPATEPYNGHHGIWAAGTTNSLFTRFYVADRYWHDVTLAIFAENTVFSNGGGFDLNIDMHRGGPHNNLLSNLNTGLGQRPFKSGGSDGRGAHSAANNTFWNIWAGSSGQLPLPPCDFGPSLTFVGAYGPPEDGSSSSDSGDRRRLLAAVGGVASAAARPAWCAAQGWWVEAAQRGSKVQPVDLHAAMVQRRLGGR